MILPQSHVPALHDWRNSTTHFRVSTDEQAAHGYSLRAQEEQLRKYCDMQGITIVEHFQDDASAKTFNRPAFQALLEYIKSHKHEIDCLLFVKWDRFSRNATDAWTMLRLLNSLGVTAQAIEQPVDTTVPEQKLMLSFYLTAPEVENDRRSLNTRAGLRRAMREGRWVNRAPIGYRPTRDEGNRPIIVPSDDAPFVREAFEEMSKGVYTIDEIRKSLQRKGLRCSKNQFGLMLRNPFYMGMIVIPAWQDEPEEQVEGLHAPLIPPSLFYRVQEVLNGP